MTVLDLPALLALAEAATPGPWESGTDGWVETVSGDEQTERDAAFIAAANPTAVKELVSRLQAAEAARERARALADEWFQGPGPNPRWINALQAALEPQ
jgi:hypothetical protein